MTTAIITPVQAQPLVDAARQQIGVTTVYDGRYQPLAYPNGDVPMTRGVCTDVVIRAFRVLGTDLQQRVHEDMLRAWSSYPPLWGLRRPDANIDHRRVPNLVHYFARQGWRISPGTMPADFQPGDLVTWLLPGNLPHIGVVSDRRVDDRPLIIHNIGAGVVEEDVLNQFPITGQFRPH
ncbi:DUF1287 domain-containing protein [Permianibacter sp. IMCC34836]|uniref:DUF1287 domain-containing protein n=1 Tax=Permianibacter fluminis TaxID=2738515 RepID=UPI001555816F|nr:DUF1287 domain-containing protein [Permianibacter fluminis]NQD38767.1 DUF1287 domain-containing protein [Permianibacter fluminis]